MGFHEKYSIGEASFSHYGVDLAADPGSPVRAAAGGSVSFVGAVPVTGRLEGQTMRAVSVTMADGRIMTFMPLDDVTVVTGDVLDEGDVIGALAGSGDSSCAAAHLHVGLKRGGAYYDPLELLGGSPAKRSQEADGLGDAGASSSSVGGPAASGAPEHAEAAEAAVAGSVSSVGPVPDAAGALPQASPETVSEGPGGRVSSGGVTSGALEGSAAGTAWGAAYGDAWAAGLGQQGVQTCFAALITEVQQCFGQVRGLLCDMGASLPVLAACLPVSVFGLACVGLLLLLKRMWPRIAVLHLRSRIKQLKLLFAHKREEEQARRDAVRARPCPSLTAEGRRQKPISDAFKGLKVRIGKGKARQAV